MDILNIFDFNMMNSELGLRYLLNLVFAFLLTRVVYYRNYKRGDLFITFFSFNSIIFFVSFMLNKVELSTVAAFGLFAVFSILRYRTEGISAKDMTYLFLNIAIGLLTAVSVGSFFEIGIICCIILLNTILLESNLIVKKESFKLIHYDNINLVNDSNSAELLEDLKKRTGLNIKRFDINEIDFLKDTCTITIYFIEK